LLRRIQREALTPVDSSEPGLGLSGTPRAYFETGCIEKVTVVHELLWVPKLERSQVVYL